MIPTKVCTLCKTEKPITEFHRHTGSVECPGYGHRHPRCKQCRKIYGNQYYKKNKKQLRAKAKLQRKLQGPPPPGSQYKYQLKKKYGITLNDYMILRDQQNGLCFICNGEPKKNQKLHVDHDHITGKIRGLLCPDCNRGLGSLNDNVSFLKKAIIYLETIPLPDL